jgi:signal transduction histidine kinase
MTIERTSFRGEQLEGVLEARLKVLMHEIRQPLSAVLALAEAARTVPGVAAEVRGYLEQIIDQAQELSGAAASVLVPKERSVPWTGATMTCIDIDEVVDSVIGAVRLTWGGTLIRRGDRGAVWTTGGSRAALRRCLIDVVDNAVRAGGPEGTVVVSVSRGTDAVRIVVEDDGPGFGRGPRGAGLGLGITRQTLESMGAGLSVGLPSERGGALVVLSLRVQDAGPADATQSVRAV